VGTDSPQLEIPVADKLDVQVTGKSKYEVAHEMAINILTVMEKKKYADITRKEYLTAVSQAIDALHAVVV
jgi:hypothetical protein